MRRGERMVKRLDAKFPRVFFEAISAHQCDRAQPPDVGVVESSTVIEIESHRRIAELVATKMPVVDQERTGESRLHHEPITRIEIQDDEFRAAPASHYCRVLKSPRERTRAYFAQHVALPNGNVFYRSPANRPVEIAGDRFSFR